MEKLMDQCTHPSDKRTFYNEVFGGDLHMMETCGLCHKLLTQLSYDLRAKVIYCEYNYLSVKH